MPDPVESRLATLEHGLYDMHARMQRSEDSCAYLSQKNTILMDNMIKCQQVRLLTSRDSLQLIYGLVES